jgi:hypothetical protein
LQGWIPNFRKTSLVYFWKHGTRRNKKCTIVEFDIRDFSFLFFPSLFWNSQLMEDLQAIFFKFLQHPLIVDLECFCWSISWCRHFLFFWYLPSLTCCYLYY